MKHHYRRSLIGLLLTVAMLAAALPAAMAGQVGPKTVHAAFLKGMNIYVDGVPIGFYTEDGRQVRAIDYGGQVYIPIRTVGEWLGGKARWDEGENTILLTTGDTPHYQDLYVDPPDYMADETAADRERRDQAIKYGFDLTLRPDVAVVLDGEPQALTGAVGEALSPVELWDHLYLPLEPVAAMCGKDMVRSPMWQVEMEVTKQDDFSALYEPYRSTGYAGMIQLFDRPTGEQLAAARRYLKEAEDLFWTAADMARDLQDVGTITTEAVKAEINAIADRMTAIQQLPRPDGTFFIQSADDIGSVAKLINLFDLSHFIEILDHGYAPADYMTPEHWGRHMFQCLYRMRTTLEYAKAYLGDVAALLPTSFTDQADIVHTQAVAELARLKIISGVEDGTAFAPERIVTRGEMAKMLAVMLNGGTDPLLKQTNPGAEPMFTDLAGHWSQPYVTYCVNLGILAGRGDGTFGPDDPVSGRECAKMLLVAIGHIPKEEGFEGADWSINVLVRANQIDLFAGLDDLADYMVPLSRDNAAQLVFNGLHANLVEYVSRPVSVGGELTSRFIRQPMDPAQSLFSRHFSQA